MVLDVERHRAFEPAVFPDDEVVRRPSGRCRSATGIVQRRQEFVTQEWIAARQPIPLFAIDAGQGMDDVQRHDPRAPPRDGVTRAGNARLRA